MEREDGEGGAMQPVGPTAGQVKQAAYEARRRAWREEIGLGNGTIGRRTSPDHLTLKPREG